jgi:hypothetical protein
MIDPEAILNLRSHPGIAQSVADRQLAVIEKAYAFLSQPQNGMIYIADEVGLGKTYIGLGIATLLRHHHNGNTDFKDLILVPKKNLQDKWLKELRNFAKKNYLRAGPGYEAAAGAANIICERLRPILPEAGFTILRNTSFSSVISSRYKVREYLDKDVFNYNPFCTRILWKAYDKGYFNPSNRALQIRLAACMLNAMSVKVNCLIIDEAHNYKKGPQSDTIRNQVVARFLGTVVDDEIMNDFPELKAEMKFPLAVKVICLSATPKDRHLLELKHQVSCFTNNNPLADCETPEEIKDMLPKFLIRGNMEYTLGGEKFSRNQCRHEHRNGNVDKQPDGQPITLNDGIENVFWQLLQYKSIRHLSQKAGASFEIGMLAGFESYKLDMDKRVARQSDDEGDVNPDKEYDLLNHRTQKHSEDANVIRSLIDSYRDTFGNEPPPHPKLSKLEAELIEQFGKQEKSLVFVRRLATVDELLQHLLQRYDLEIVNQQYLRLEGKWKKYLTHEVIALKKACDKFYKDKKRNDALAHFAELKEASDWWSSLYPPNSEDLIVYLRYCYLRDLPELIAALDEYLSEGRFRRKQKFAALAVLKKYHVEWQSQSGEDVAEDADDEPELRADSFFKNYFKRYQEGYKFRTKIYRENWFDFNNYLLLVSDVQWKTEAEAARLRTPALLQLSDNLRTHGVFNAYQDAFRSASSDVVTPVIKFPRQKQSNPLLKATFLTELIQSACAAEWDTWKSMRRDISIPDVLQDIAVLQAMLKSVFQHSSGLLPAFVAESCSGKFSKDLMTLLKDPDSPFHFVLQEVKTIITDQDLIVSVNFQDRDPRRIADLLKNRSPVVGASGQDKNRSAIAARFRMPGFPYALIATDIFHEGEDLHTYCQAVYHYGIAWNPSGMEQRTGRIDRINSLSYRKLTATQERNFGNKIQVFYPYLSRSVEVNQVVKLFGHVNNFLHDFNDIDAVRTYESAVKLEEEIQDGGIPQPITERITSRYDVDHFKGV